MKQKCPKTFDELQAHWYQRLYDDGFRDIENVADPERPLKEWHSRKFASERSQIRQEEQERYQQRISDFLNSSHVDEICGLIVKHGNSSITPNKVKKILEFHRDGLTQRAIAKRLRCGKKCVHITLNKAKEWMKVA